MSPIEFTSVVPGVSASDAIPGVAAGVLALSSALLLKFARNILVTKRATAARKKKHHTTCFTTTRHVNTRKSKIKKRQIPCVPTKPVSRDTPNNALRDSTRTLKNPDAKKSVIGSLETMTRTMNLSRKKNVGREYESVRQSVSQSVRHKSKPHKKEHRKKLFFPPPP